jgi:hypothetical protein
MLLMIIVSAIIMATLTVSSLKTPERLLGHEI